MPRLFVLPLILPLFPTPVALTESIFPIPTIDLPSPSFRSGDMCVMPGRAGYLSQSYYRIGNWIPKSAYHLIFLGRLCKQSLYLGWNGAFVRREGYTMSYYLRGTCSWEDGGNVFLYLLNVRGRALEEEFLLRS